MQGERGDGPGGSGGALYPARTNIVNVCLWGKFSVALLLEFEVIYKYVYLDRKLGL